MNNILVGLDSNYQNNSAECSRMYKKPWLAIESETINDKEIDNGSNFITLETEGFHG